MEVVRQQRGGGEWAGRPAAHLEPHACPLLPCQHPLHRCRSTAEPGLEPTPQKALSSHEFSSLIRSLTHSQGGESQSSDARVGKCPVWVPHFEGPPPQGKTPWSLFQKPGLRASTLQARPVEFLTGTRDTRTGHAISPQRRPRLHSQPALRKCSGWKRWASLISRPGASGTRG